MSVCPFAGGVVGGSRFWGPGSGVPVLGSRFCGWPIMGCDGRLSSQAGDRGTRRRDPRRAGVPKPPPPGGGEAPPPLGGGGGRGFFCRRAPASLSPPPH